MKYSPFYLLDNNVPLVMFGVGMCKCTLKGWYIVPTAQNSIV